MKRFVAAGLFFLGCAGAVAFAAAPRRTAHIDDTVQLLPPIPGDLDNLEAKLVEFERATGIKLLVQFRERAPSSEEDKVPGAYMQKLAVGSGTQQRGIMAVYFAEETDWRVWIGDQLIPRFVGKPGSVKQLTANGAIHDVKEALLTAAHERSEVALAQLQKTLPGDEQPAQDIKLRLQTEAILDALIVKFSAATP